MVDARKIFLELVFLTVILVILRKKGKPQHRGLALWFSGMAFTLNILFYYFAAWSMYLSFGRSQGLSSATLHLLIWFDIVKWTVLAYFCSRFVVEVISPEQHCGFLLLNRQKSLWIIPIVGIAGGLITTLLVYSLSYVEQHLGYLEGMPWQYLKGNDLYFKLGIWGGIRNLAGEEILTRLGVQSVLLYLMRKYKFSGIWAIILSSVYFEFWHNGFRELYFLNFSASMVLGLIYQKYGYESAATSHCVGDWLTLVIFPRVLF